MSPMFAANSAPAQTGGTSNAIAFAVQAGQIAGSAQGCGINISTFTTRVSEAINKLALNPTDNSAAISTFQQALQQAQIVQRNNNPIPCSQVTQDFNNLPLLRPDYEQTIIAQLTPGMADNTNPSANTQQQNLSNQPMPNTGNMNANTVTPNTANQNQAGGNNQQANPNQKPPSNPAYPPQNYGPLKSPNTAAYPGAIQSYGAANLPNQTQQNQQNTGTGQQQSNNPPPPNFSNPNNTAPVTNNYPNQ